MNGVEISEVSFGYGSEEVISDISLSVDRGEIVSLLGPSGCGKSTLLRLIAGLEIPENGRILTEGAEAGSNRDVLRFLFQDYDAYPWWNVWDNLRLGSGSHPYPADSAIKEMLSQVGLAADRDVFPGELSGGMRKRLALARCLVRQPSLLLLDEPFSSLDVDTKYGMYDLVQKLWQESRCAVIFVTHDLHDAILLADRILVSSPRPLTIRKIIEVPFERPRTDKIYDSTTYIQMLRQLTSLLRSTSTKPVESAPDVEPAPEIRL
jgi:ABC-type nitrate/sulfonate/bicarbonate transport system ATPase subunit